MKKDKQEIKTIHKMFANLHGNRNVDNLISSYLELLPNEDKNPVGRPRKPRNPVGRPRKENNFFRYDKKQSKAVDRARRKIRNRILEGRKHNII